LQKAARHAPDSVEIDLLKVSALTSLREFKTALKALSTIKQKYFMSKEELSNIYYQEAFVYEKLELFGKMFQSLKKALKQNPNNKEAQERMSLCVDLSNNHKESVAFHIALINESPYSSLLWYNLGRSYYSLFEYDKAIDAFEYAYIIEPTLEQAYRDCAEVCALLKKYNKALNCYTEMLEHVKAEEEVLVEMGKCHHFLNNTGKAKNAFYKALGHDSRNADIYYHLGECYASEFNWSTAIYFFKLAYCFSKNKVEYCSALGFAYYQNNQASKALAYFEKATQLDPVETTYWTQLTCYYIDNGDLDQAMSVLNNAEPYTYGADLLYTRAIVYLKKGNRTAAFKILDEALIEDYDLHDVLFDFIPALREDPDIKAILKYYAV